MPQDIQRSFKLKIMPLFLVKTETLFVKNHNILESYLGKRKYNILCLILQLFGLRCYPPGYIFFGGNHCGQHVRYQFRQCNRNSL